MRAFFMYRMYGMQQGAMDGGAAMTGCTVFRKEPGKDNCSCVIFIPHIHVGKGGSKFFVLKMPFTHSLQSL